LHHHQYGAVMRRLIGTGIIRLKVSIQSIVIQWRN